MIFFFFYTLGLRRYLSEPQVETTLLWMARSLLDKAELRGERVSCRNVPLEDGRKQVCNDLQQDLEQSPDQEVRRGCFCVSTLQWSKQPSTTHIPQKHLSQSCGQQEQGQHRPAWAAQEHECSRSPPCFSVTFHSILAFQ